MWGAHQERVQEGSTGNKCSVRIWKLLRPRAQERRIQRQLLLSSRQDRYLLSASETARSGSAQGPGFGLPHRLPGDADAAGLRTTLGEARF